MKMPNKTKIKDAAEILKCSPEELAQALERQSYVNNVPEGCKVVCEKCGSDMEQSCGWPTNCNVPSRAISADAPKDDRSLPSAPR